MRLLVAGKWSGLELALEGTCLARLVPKNSPWLLFLPNLLAGEEEDGQTSKSPPPPCPLPSLLMLKEKKKKKKSSLFLSVVTCGKLNFTQNARAKAELSVCLGDLQKVSFQLRSARQLGSIDIVQIINAFTYPCYLPAACCLYPAAAVKSIIY